MQPLIGSRFPLRLLALAGPLLLAAGCGPPDRPRSGGEVTHAAPATKGGRGFSLRDVNGTEHHPFAGPGIKAVTLLFVLSDCPIANGYAPEINRLCQDYGPRGVRFFLVQVDPDLSSAEASRHARAYGYTCPVVLDPRHALVRRAGATVVPEAAVFASDGARKYRGRIDDRYADLGKRRARVSRRDLRDALDAVLAGRPVAHPLTRAVGCFIPPLSPKEPQP
jgi:hypothetical protein